MSFALILERQIASLVHPNVLTCQAERSRHEAFILRRLASSVSVMCLAPLFLAIYGAPAVWHALVFVWCVLPIGAVVLLSRSGDLLLAQTICVISFIGAAATIAAGGGPWEAALAWLVLAPFEGVLSQNFRLVFAGGALAALAAAALALADQTGWIRTGFGTGHTALLILPAIFYATLLAYGIAEFQRKRDRSAQLRAEHYRAVYDTVGDLVVHHDRNGVAEFVSPNCMELFGLPAAELMGRGLFERVHVADRPALLKAVVEFGFLYRHRLHHVAVARRPAASQDRGTRRAGLSLGRDALTPFQRGVGCRLGPRGLDSARRQPGEAARRGF